MAAAASRPAPGGRKRIRGVTTWRQRARTAVEEGTPIEAVLPVRSKLNFPRRLSPVRRHFGRPSFTRLTRASLFLQPPNLLPLPGVATPSLDQRQELPDIRLPPGTNAPSIGTAPPRVISRAGPAFTAVSRRRDQREFFPVAGRSAHRGWLRDAPLFAPPGSVAKRT